MADKKIKLTKRDRFNVMWHSQFLQGSWNYERMQNGGYAYSMIPALRKLYPDKKDLSAALVLPWLWNKIRLTVQKLLMTLSKVLRLV